MITHNELCLVAERWLEGINCGVILRDPFRAKSATGEQPDAIGWRNDCSVLIEVKVSRSDFLSDKRKKFRACPEQGVGDWRFYLSPEDVISVEDLPKGWGLLHYKNGRVYKVQGVPFRSNWGKDYPFSSNKVVEVSLLTSALRRVKLRGHFEDIYDSVLNL